MVKFNPTWTRDPTYQKQCFVFCDRICMTRQKNSYIPIIFWKRCNQTGNFTESSCPYRIPDSHWALADVELRRLLASGRKCFDTRFEAPIGNRRQTSGITSSEVCDKHQHSQNDQRKSNEPVLSNRFIYEKYSSGVARLATHHPASD
jgi:hypothetical protein